MRTSTWIAVALGTMWLSAAPGLAGGMAEQYEANLRRSHCESLGLGADFLASAQVMSEEGAVGWSWQLGAESVAPNQAGLVSLSLLDAYEALGDEAHLQAVERYAEALVARHLRSAEPLRAYKADIELLARLGRLLHAPVYAEAARELFQQQQRRAASGEAEVARIAVGRRAQPSLLGFDVALAIRAALAVDERRYAYQLADAVLARSARWYRPAVDLRFSLISAAALVPALEALDGKHFARVLSRLRGDLARTQRPEGSWLANESQVTAYAVLALADSPRVEERQAALRGAAWLKSTALAAGAFATFNDFMPEPFVGEVLSGVSAEALQALAPLCRAELGR